jgi:hypothetical protein
MTMELPPDLVARVNLAMWWFETSENDRDMVEKKLRAYGPLAFHGAAMLEMEGRKIDGGKDGQLRVVASYVAGKLNRVLSALGRGEIPDEDSWRDICTYSMMARWITKFGGWP